MRRHCVILLLFGSTAGANHALALMLLCTPFAENGLPERSSTLTGTKDSVEYVDLHVLWTTPTAALPPCTPARRPNERESGGALALLVST